MTFWKLLGGGLIVLAGGIVAHQTVKREKKRLSVLDGWLDLLLYIRGQIDCYLMPLDEILAAADKTLLVRAGAVRATDSLRAIYASALPYLDAESGRLIASLIRELGTSYREEQVKRCDYYLGALQKQREKLAAELPARVKMYTTLSICAAVGTAILLW